MYPWWRQREYRCRYTVKDDGISQVEVILYRPGIEKSVIWLYLFAEVRGRDRGQQYEPPYCFDRIPPQIKIFTKSNHPKNYSKISLRSKRFRASSSRKLETLATQAK